MFSSVSSILRLQTIQIDKGERSQKRGKKEAETDEEKEVIIDSKNGTSKHGG